MAGGVAPGSRCIYLFVPSRGVLMRYDVMLLKVVSSSLRALIDIVIALVAGTDFFCSSLSAFIYLFLIDLCAIYEHVNDFEDFMQ